MKDGEVDDIECRISNLLNHIADKHRQDAESMSDPYEIVACLNQAKLCERLAAAFREGDYCDEIIEYWTGETW